MPAKSDVRILEVMRVAADAYAAALYDQGETIEGALVKVSDYLDELDRWRKQSLASIARKLDEPSAPTHSIQ